MPRIGIEHAHRVGKKDKNNNTSRTIVLTFSSFKGIEQILKVNKQKNGGDCYIN